MAVEIDNVEFDPEGSGFDMKTAIESGDEGEINPEDGKLHFGSIDPRTGMLLKGMKHPTVDKAITGERARGRKLFKRGDGRYYSVPDFINGVDDGSIKWIYPSEVAISLEQEWTPSRIELARGELKAWVTPTGPLPQSEEETQYKLNDWWKKSGQHMPDFVLDELGILGGTREPTDISQIQADSKEAAKHLKRILGIKIEGDPLQAFMKSEADKPENFDPFNLEIPPEATDIIKSASDEDLEYIFGIMNENFMDFPVNVVKAAVEERELRDEVKKILPTIEANPIEILRGSQFLDVLSVGLTRSVGTKEKKLTLKAIGRIRQGLYEEDPTILNYLSLNVGGIAAELIKFTLLPDVGKLAVFDKLSKAAKAAIGVGSKSGLIALLNAPKEGETIEDRAKEIAVATGVGALTGAAFSKIVDAANVGMAKLSSMQVKDQAQWIIDAVSKEGGTLAITRQELEKVLLRLDSENPEAFKAIIKATTKNLKGFRPGFAETNESIELAKQAAEEAIEAKTVQGAISLAAKEFALKQVQGLSANKVSDLMIKNTEGDPNRKAIKARIKKAGDFYVQKEVNISELKGQLTQATPEAGAKTESKGPIIIDETGEIIDGRHRVALAISEGKETIDALVPIKRGAISEAKAMAGIEEARTAPSKAPKVKKVEPLKIVSPEEAGPFQVTFAATGTDPGTKLIQDPVARKLLQTAENTIAGLKTRLAQANADAKVDKVRGITIAKAKANVQLAKRLEAEIQAKEKALAIEKTRGMIKVTLVDTLRKAQLKILKIRNTEKITTEEFRTKMRDDILSMTPAIESSLQEEFISDAFEARTIAQFNRLADKIDQSIEDWAKKFQIKKARKAFKKIEREGRFGDVRLGKLDEPYKTSIAKIIDSIDLVNLSEAKEKDLLSLQEHMKRIAGPLAGDLEALDFEVQQGVLLPAKRKAELLRLSKAKASDMTSEEIASIIEDVQMLAKQAALKGKLTVGNSLKPAVDAVKPINEALAPTLLGKAKVARTAKRASIGEGEQQDLTALESAASLANRVSRINGMTLATVIESITYKSKDDAIREIFDFALHKGRRLEDEALIGWIDKSRERFDKIGFTSVKQLQEKHSIMLAGKLVEVTAGQLVKLELKARDPRNLKSMLNTTGWKVGRLDKDYPVTMTRAERLTEISDAVAIVRKDPMLTGIADWINELNPELADAVDSNLEPLLGHPVSRDRGTYTSDKKALDRKTAKTVANISIPIEYQGSFVEVVGGTQRTDLPSVENDFLNMLVTDAKTYMAEPLRNMRIILNNGTFQQAMKTAGRGDELSALFTLYDRIQGERRFTSLFEIGVGKFRGVMTKTALSWRLSTRILQRLSYPLFHSEIDAKYFRFLPHVPKAYIDAMRVDSATLDLKWRGGQISVDIGEVNSREAFDQLIFGKAASLGTKGMRGLTKGDQQGIGNGHRAVVKEVLGTPRNGKNVKPEDWNGYKVADLIALTDDLMGPAGYPTSPGVRWAAARRTEYLAARSQPGSDPLNLSVRMSDPSPSIRTWHMFRTSLEAMRQPMTRAWAQFVHEPTAENFRFVRKAGSALVASAFLAGVWKRYSKWAGKAGARKAKEEAFDVFTFEEERDFDEIVKDSTLDTFKNIVRYDPFGSYLVNIGEIVADRVSGDGYNWNREVVDNPVLEALNYGISTFISAMEFGAEWKALENYVVHTADGVTDATTQEELQDMVNKGKIKSTDAARIWGDIEFNNALAEKFVDSLSSTVGSIYDFAARVSSKVPVLAIGQEWISPFFQKQKIELIKELTFENVGTPKLTKAYAQQVFDLYEVRTSLMNQKERLTVEEEEVLFYLEKYVTQAAFVAKYIKSSDSIEAQSFALASLKQGMADEITSKLKAMKLLK